MISKICTKCKKEKEAEYFHIHKYTKDKLQSRCKECFKESRRVWCEKNPEKRKEIQENWYKNNPGKRGEQEATWCKNNPEKRNIANARRRATKKNATLNLPEDQNKLIGEFYKESTRLSRETGIPHEVDHIIPLQGDIVSGLHVPWNLQVITAEDNRKKGVKLEDI